MATPEAPLLSISDEFGRVDVLSWGAVTPFAPFAPARPSSSPLYLAPSRIRGERSDRFDRSIGLNDLQPPLGNNMIYPLGYRLRRMLPWPCPSGESLVDLRIDAIGERPLFLIY